VEHKSERIKQTALSHGWKAEVLPKLHRYEKSGDPGDIEWHVYAMRDKETIHVLYLGNRFVSSTYSYGNHKQYPARSGGVLKLLAGKPDPRKLEGSDPAMLLESRSVPWDESTPALEIMLAVLGRTITWVRKIDGEVCNAYIDKATNVGKTYFRLSQSKAGRRILEWQDREGFHSVGLEQIIDVS
jgi:hypothetical protein